MTLALLLAQPEPVETSLTWPEIATGIAAVVVVASGLLAALGVWVRHVVRREAEPARQQLATSNGHTVGELAESTSATVTELRRMADANRARVDALDARLDRHIVAGHRAE